MAEKVPKLRLDELVVERGLADSVEHARALIMAGRVVVDERRRDKAGERYKADCKVALKGEKVPGGWASRGAHKLLGAIDAFEGLADAIVDAQCVDIGASTGGFTDVLLKHGAQHVVAIDVGYGQLVWRLQQDPRVTVMDRTNVRSVTRDDLPHTPTVVTCDASFTQVATFVPDVASWLDSGGWFVVLVKPQFELPAERVGAGGIVTDAQARQDALQQVIDAAEQAGLSVAGAVDSPLAGTKGNREWLLALRA